MRPWVLRLPLLFWSRPSTGRPTGRRASTATLARTALTALPLLSSLGGCEQFVAVGSLAEDTRVPDPVLVVSDDDPTAEFPAAEDETKSDGPPDAGEDDAANELGDSCERPAVAVCDPIFNTGCPAELRMQCAVDLAAEELAGYCTFSAPLDAGVPVPPPTAPGFDCLNLLVTESCPPTTVCYENDCRSLCLCDSDCGPTDCCRTALGTSGFKVCMPCAATTAPGA